MFRLCDGLRASQLTARQHSDQFKQTKHKNVKEKKNETKERKRDMRARTATGVGRVMSQLKRKKKNSTDQKRRLRYGMHSDAYFAPFECYACVH